MPLDRNEAHVLGKITKDQDVAGHQARDGILFAVVGELSRLAEEKRQMFVNGADLLTPTGVATAQAEQGLIKGLEYTINFIMEIGNERTE